jgi:hypothetical protein
MRRVAVALLAAVGCQNALAQWGLPIRNFRVDVAPLRLNAGSLVGAAGTIGSACPSPGGPHDGVKLSLVALRSDARE